ncbi:diacylglycerol/lipid kinase family protein [Microbacterium kyungheense]|uniref:Diacylglycerol kinase family enzyme n=1 Tax=Microbacterium kyungheense TaxID=1263636 RepID=A0A543FJD1_9MICO|nr:diacylglycerol kinase family protein [Microbacterium kyungheense]TQM33979.1 diacylglycerol kinase family enzyme [Microbacterium kyungheense]
MDPANTAHATGRGVLLVRNARSGTAVIRPDPAPTIADRLPEAVVRELADGEDLDEVVAAAMRTDAAPDVLGIYGGDGSVSRMAHLARRHERPLFAMPGGTFNHFVRALGLDSVEIAIDAFQAGSSVEVGVADATADDDEPLTVLNVVSVGAYPELIEERERRSSLGKWIGGVFATASALRRAEPLTIVREGRRARVWSVFVSVGRNDPERVATMQRQEAETGVLDIRIHHARGSKVRALASLAFGERSAAVLRALRLYPRDEDVERLVLREFEITVRPEAGHPSVFVHDGELEERDPGGFRLRCVARPAALTVFAPAPGP